MFIKDEASGRCQVKSCLFWQVGFWVRWARIQSYMS